MPPVEMLACGGAVLSAPAGAVEEVASPAAHIIRSSEIGDWREALAEIATDNEWHEQLTSKALETASRHTWKRCAELTLMGYQKTLGQIAQIPGEIRQLQSHAA
jgi:glycosyltransferase involved in cell wall biosynthesis